MVLVLTVERGGASYKTPGVWGKLGPGLWLPALNPRPYLAGSLPGPVLRHPKHHRYVTGTWFHSLEATERGFEPEPI